MSLRTTQISIKFNNHIYSVIYRSWLNMSVVSLYSCLSFLKGMCAFHLSMILHCRDRLEMNLETTPGKCNVERVTQINVINIIQLIILTEKSIIIYHWRRSKVDQMAAVADNPSSRSLSLLNWGWMFEMGHLTQIRGRTTANANDLHINWISLKKWCSFDIIVSEFHSKFHSKFRFKM